MDSASSIIPPKLLTQFKDISLLHETPYSKIFRAVKIANNEIYTLRALDIFSQAYLKNADETTTLFMQEVLHICLKIGSADSHYSDAFSHLQTSGKMMAFALDFSCRPISEVPLEDIRTKIEQIISDLEADVKHLSKKVQITDHAMKLQNIYYCKPKDKYFLANWTAVIRESMLVQEETKSQILETNSSIIQANQPWSSELPSVLHALGRLVLKLFEIDPLENFADISDPEQYNIVISEIVSHLPLSTPAQKTLARILHSDPLQQCELEIPSKPIIASENQIFLDDETVKPEKIYQEAWSNWKSQKFALSANNNYSSLCWCTQNTNTIYISTLEEGTPTKSFEGVQLGCYEGDRKFTIISPIIDGSNFFISTSYDWKSSANFEVLTLNKNKMQKLYHHGDVKGIINDLSYNKKRNIATLLSNETVPFHIFDCNTMKVIKQSKTFQGGTQESYSLKLLRTVLEGPPAVVQGIDIDPQGRFVAYADKSTKYFISGLDTGETVRVSHKSLETDWDNLCRWNPTSPMIAFTFGGKHLCALDSEKLTITNEISNTDESGGITKIDWHPEGNLLACGSSDKLIYVYDLRQDKLVYKSKRLHDDYVRSVRWSPCGKYIATSSDDKYVKLLDFGKREVVLKKGFPDEEIDRKKNPCSLYNQ